MKLPQGYEPHEIPADYTGPLFIEGQMNRMYERGFDDGFIVGAEKGRNISEEIKQAKREALMEAANEIERLRDEIAVEEKRFSAQWEILAASQARETKLREAIHFTREYVGEERLPALPGWSWFDAVNMPHDDTALKEAIKQAKREALLKAADMCGESRWTELELRQLAEELK